MKLGTEWVKKTNYRRLKDRGSITFHIQSLDVRKAITFFDENKKPIRETDPNFADRMTKWELLKQQKYEAKQSANEEEVKQLDELIYKNGPSIRFYFDIINRATEQHEILEVTPGVANQINAYFLKGYTNVSHDFILENTGEMGIKKYVITPAPTKKPLTEKELKEINKIDEEQVINPNDIPF